MITSKTSERRSNFSEIRVYNLSITKRAVKKEYIETTKRFAQEAERNGYQIDSLYLFGSRISGTSTKWSDLDICVVSPTIKDNPFDDRVRLLKISQKVNDAIEPHPMSVQDFNNDNYTLTREIKKTGYRVI